MRRAQVLLAIALLAIAFYSARADSPEATQELVVEGAWSRATAGPSIPAAVYFQLRNTGTRNLTLIGVTTRVAGSASIHETVMQGDRMTMRPVDRISLPGGSELAFEPSGLHVMLQDLVTPLEEGKRFVIELRFEGDLRLEVEVDVQPIGSRGPKARAPEAGTGVR